MCQRSAFTPSSSKPVVASPPGCVRSPTRLTIGAPKRSVPASVGLMKLVPAMFASQPSARSSSVEWPTDSWIARNSCDGSTTMLYLPGDDRFRFQLLDDLVAGFLGVAQPRVVLDVLVADELRAIDDGARLEIAAGAIGGRGAELRIGPHQPLRDARSLARREVLLLVDEQDLRADEGHARHRQRCFVQLHQERDLGLERHVERIALERAGPGRHHLVGVGEHDLARREDARWRARWRRPVPRRRAAAAGSTRLVAAKPHAPLTSTRRPRPRLVERETFCTCRSRVAIDSRR